jgi:hypothetical protein
MVQTCGRGSVHWVTELLSGVCPAQALSRDTKAAAQAIRIDLSNQGQSFRECADYH